MASSRILDSAGGVDTSTSRAALLEELRRTATPMTVQELADRLTLHPNSIRFHLARLAREGLVREEHPVRSRQAVSYTHLTLPTKA